MVNLKCLFENLPFWDNRLKNLENLKTVSKEVGFYGNRSYSKKPAASFLGAYGLGADQERTEHPRMVQTERHRSQDFLLPPQAGPV